MGSRGQLRKLVLGCALCVACPASAQVDEAGPDLSNRAPRKPNLTFDFSLHVRYDDNILHLSDCDKESVDRGIPSLPCPDDPTLHAGHKGDRLKSSDDTVTLGSFQVRYSTRPFRHRETILTADADVYRYSRNSIKNWSESSLSLSQEISASRRM